MSNYTIIDEPLTYEYLAPFYNYFNRYFPDVILCKYYDDGEKHDIGVPDILAAIDGEIRLLEDDLSIHARCARSKEDAYNRTHTRYTPNQLKQLIAVLEKVRDNVVDGEDIFYTFDRMKRWSTFDDFSVVLTLYETCVKPVKRIHMNTLYRPFYDDATGKWKAELDDREEKKCGALICGKAVYNSVTLDKIKIAVLFSSDCWSTIPNFSDIVVTETPEEIDNLNNAPVTWNRCKKCNRVFYSYNNKRFKLCYACDTHKKK